MANNEPGSFPKGMSWPSNQRSPEGKTLPSGLFTPAKGPKLPASATDWLRTERHFTKVMVCPLPV